MKSFRTYGEAKAEADKKVRELAEGSQAAGLGAAEARDALAALERLRGFYTSTGRRVSLLSAVSEFTDAATRAGGHPLTECVVAYLRTVAVVKRNDIKEAVAEFIASRKHLAEAKDGKRAQLSPVYAYNVAMWLNEFAGTFPGHAICDLTKQHLNTYIRAHDELSAKSRNDRRAVVKMFLEWCVCQDYLSPGHRLFEASDLKREKVDLQDIDYYRPAELRCLLDAADRDLRSTIALAALAGLRVEEIMRLDWNDVWRVSGHIEIKAIKSKTRQRRLVEMVCLSQKDKDGKEYKLPANLLEWLTPFRECSGPLWPKSSDAFHESFARLRESLADRENDPVNIPARRNGLRHAFCTYHFALHSNENLTAAQAGNSPAMIHTHYKGLATKAEAEEWFAVKPARTANVIPLAAQVVTHQPK